MNLHFNKDIFLKRLSFYNTIHCLVFLLAGWAVVADQKCQMKKSLFHSEKPVEHLTFGPQPTT